MADYSVAFSFMLANEDANRSGIVTPDPVNDPPDHVAPDAVARFGINSYWHPEAVSEGFYQMSTADALEWVQDFYKYRYFAAIRGYDIAAQDIANKLFDMAVNQGCSEATKIVQRAANHILAPVAVGYLPLTVDGLCGPQTIQAVNACAPEQLLPEIKNYAVQFIKDVAFRQKWPNRKLAALITRYMR